MIRFASQNVLKLPRVTMPIKGIIPGARMFSLQESIPKLPVPSLDQTLQKYLSFVKILVPEQQYQQTVQTVEDFQHKTGPDLQTRLLNFARTKENWLADWWTDAAYLGNRLPLTINVNPGTVMPPADFIGDDKQIQLAAHIIAAILDYKSQIDDQSLAVEYLGKRPLCMSQFYKILSACRVPRPHKDEWFCYPPNEPNPPTHVVVTHKNRFYRLDVYDAQKRPLTIAQLYQQLTDLANRNVDEAPPVGILTTMQRDDWTQAYQHLCADNQNATNCDVINRSIVVVCLDKHREFDGSADEGMAQSLHQCIHGHGSQWNTGNRWFDKTLQFVVGSENQSGVCYEHTSAEGPPVTSLMDHVTNFVKNQRESLGPSGVSAASPTELVFNVDKVTDDWIGKASQRINEAISHLDLRAITYDGYGKRFIKQNKLSPDAYIQQAIQLTYQRLHNEPGNTYESGSTRMFAEGRTDTIRTCSRESQAFVTAIDRSDVGATDKAQALRDAVVTHRKITDDLLYTWLYSRATIFAKCFVSTASRAITGQGIDRHLLGLKLTAIKNSLPLPHLFTDPSFATLMSFKLSTSQVTAKSEPAVMAYGPAMTDGYAVCYNPADDKIYVSVASFKESNITDIDRFTRCLRESLDDMMAVMGSTQRSKL